jgi:hypothetical protein
MEDLARFAATLFLITMCLTTGIGGLLGWWSHYALDLNGWVGVLGGFALGALTGFAFIRWLLRQPYK